MAWFPDWSWAAFLAGCGVGVTVMTVAAILSTAGAESDREEAAREQRERDAWNKEVAKW